MSSPCTSPCPTCGGSVSQIIPAPCAPEDHNDPAAAECCCSKQFVEVSQPFNWPSVGGEVTLRACCAEGVTPGAVLYSLGLGYLHVEGVPSECEIVAKNMGEPCNVRVAGEPIAAGAKLLVGVPPCIPSSGSSSGSINCLTTSFLVPEYCSSPSDTGACCVDVGVTTVAGLNAGDRLMIGGTREFRLTEIKTPTIIRICNDGLGGMPGAMVAAGDCFTVIDGGNPCGKAAQETANVILGCKNGEQVPIAGSYDGQIFQWNQAAGEWELVSAPPLPVCTSLVCCLTLDPENPPDTSYIIEVDDSSIFEANNLITINQPNGTQRRFTVNAVIDATHIRITPAFTVTEITSFDEGAAVCQIPDVCGQEAVEVPEEGVRALVACNEGGGVPLAASSAADANKVMVGCGSSWKEANRLLGFKPILTNIYNGLTTPVSFPVLGTIPPQVCGQQRYAVLEIGLLLSAPATGGTELVGYVNNSPVLGLDSIAGGLDDESGYRYIFVPVTDGDSILLQALRTGAATTTAIMQVQLMGYLA